MSKSKDADEYRKFHELNKKISSHSSIMEPPKIATFELPYPMELINLEEGDFVKFIFLSKDGKSRERMWAIIGEINGLFLTCILENIPKGDFELNVGDVFRGHVYQIIDFNKKDD